MRWLPKNCWPNSKGMSDCGKTLPIPSGSGGCTLPAAALAPCIYCSVRRTRLRSGAMQTDASSSKPHLRNCQHHQTTATIQPLSKNVESHVPSQAFVRLLDQAFPSCDIQGVWGICTRITGVTILHARELKTHVRAELCTR